LAEVIAQVENVEPNGEMYDARMEVIPDDSGAQPSERKQTLLADSGR
jgi:hypothetical protein